MLHVGKELYFMESVKCALLSQDSLWWEMNTPQRCRDVTEGVICVSHSRHHQRPSADCRLTVPAAVSLIPKWSSSQMERDEESFLCLPSHQTLFIRSTIRAFSSVHAAVQVLVPYLFFFLLEYAKQTTGLRVTCKPPLALGGRQMLTYPLTYQYSIYNITELFLTKMCSFRARQANS